MPNADPSGSGALHRANVELDSRQLVQSLAALKIRSEATIAQAKKVINDSRRLVEQSRSLEHFKSD
jgi:hypothetical protein